MTDNPALSEEEAAAIKGMSVWQMLGELLSVAADFVQWRIERHLGGPGAIRRLLSIIAAFVTVIKLTAVRLRATIQHHRPVSASRVLRHLRCPPSRWAAA